LEVAALKNVLVLNGGSSSFKAAVFSPSDPQPVWQRSVELGDGDPTETIEQLVAAAREAASIEAVGHRIVHGGKAFRETTRITPEVKAGIAQMASFAPEHNLLEVEGIEIAERLLAPGTPQVAVFDTGFHSTLPPAARTYPGPYGWVDRGIYRYGFHGISHQYVSARAAELLGRELKSLRMITCHLGSGCSLAAIRDGRSIDTTMGFTPLEGLMMGTRSGSIDPGILIYLVRHCGATAQDLGHARDSFSHGAGPRAGATGIRYVRVSTVLRDRRDASGAGPPGRVGFYGWRGRALSSRAAGRGRCVRVSGSGARSRAERRAGGGRL
jgi:acetate kinase